MSGKSAELARTRDRRWLIGWLLRVCGGAILAGGALGIIGALRKWGLDFPPATVTTMGIALLIGGILIGGGQLLMQASPRVSIGNGDGSGEETQQ